MLLLKDKPFLLVIGKNARDLEYSSYLLLHSIPQVLLDLKAISISPELRQELQWRKVFPVDSVQVLKLRAASIVACDALRQNLGISAVQLDYFLRDWVQQNKHHLDPSLPFHRTRSVFY